MTKTVILSEVHFIQCLSSLEGIGTSVGIVGQINFSKVNFSNSWSVLILVSNSKVIFLILILVIVIVEDENLFCTY